VRILLVRHGDKEPGDWLGTGLGHQDNPLSARGREEAARVAPFLAAARPGAIRASRYGRTSETARPLAQLLGLSVAVDPRLDEIDVGDRDKLSDEELASAYPDFWRSYNDFDRDFRYPGGESGADVAERAASFLAETLSSGIDTVAFTHDGFIRITSCLVLGLPLHFRRKLRCDTTGVTELEWDGARGEWILRRMNQRP